MRIWFKTFHNNHMLRDSVVENEDYSLNRTKKIFDAIEQVCYEFDLSKPIWLKANIAEFKRHGKVRFYQDCFIDTIDFDYLEMQVIEED